MIYQDQRRWAPFYWESLERKSHQIPVEEEGVNRVQYTSHRPLSVAKSVLTT